MVVGCSGKHVTVHNDNTLTLDGCLLLPNCVSSNAWEFYNSTSPFELLIPVNEAWPMIKETISNIPRTEIIEESDTYIHARCRTRVFRFIDHLELVLDPVQNTIAVRSSSTLAIFDLGVNRLRIYNLRKQLIEKKIIKQ
jgi:uncharacterized protein (DUF1499 family)